MFKNIFRNIGFAIMTSRSEDILRSSEKDLNHLFDFILKSRGIDPINSKSQLKQDIFVLLEKDFKSNGFFVEFGATDGICLSNTYILEKKFNWNGILAEPGRQWHKDLKNNRSASIEENCVWSKSGEIIDFMELDDGEFSTIKEFSDIDDHKRSAMKFTKHKVETISLEDMLVKHGAPSKIDYLSIDTEGSEYDILKEFDFQKYDISVITCEHNFTDSREDLFKLLSSNGYERKYTGASKFDDWYVKNV
tara:strand:- start:2731 stop:3477 length:747 start_codon:yes stop_codon:yes gene_type:complete